LSTLWLGSETWEVLAETKGVKYLAGKIECVQKNNEKVDFSKPGDW
jgi:hypothetical protein